MIDNDCNTLVYNTIVNTLFTYASTDSRYNFLTYTGTDLTNVYVEHDRPTIVNKDKRFQFLYFIQSCQTVQNGNNVDDSQYDLHVTLIACDKGQRKTNMQFDDTSYLPDIATLLDKLNFVFLWNQNTTLLKASGDMEYDLTVQTVRMEKLYNTSFEKVSTVNYSYYIRMKLNSII